MNISCILNKNYKIISEEYFRNHTVSLKDEEADAILICTAQQNIIGAVTKESTNEMIPVVFINTETIVQLEDKLGKYSIWIMKDDQNNVLGWTDSLALYRFYYQQLKAEKEYYHKILTSLPHQVTVIDHNSHVFFMNDKKISDDYSESSLEHLLSYDEEKTIVKLTNNKKGIYTQTNILDQGKAIGAIQIYWEAEEIEKIAMNLDSYANLALDLKSVFETSYDVIYVADGEGVTLRVSSACERLWGYKAKDLIGKSVYQLEKNGVYKPSITRLVLEKGEMIRTIQTTKTGKRLMVVGTPIRDENGQIIRVINTSRDITNESKLQLELEDTRTLMEGYKRELEQLKQLNLQDDQFIFKSEQMKNMVTMASKVSEVDSTALILGESGVGKEVIASYIHQNSQRKEKPFIKVNCGAIPENLVESELFGYEKGAFTGASKNRKLGLFELANDGTLFLDEIGEIPMALQVKLLRVLQESEFLRVGGTKTVQINVRVIAATNRNLHELTKKGLFREDLYYRLNVVPLLIPPLRERKDDVLPLILHFVKTFNLKYKKNKTFSQTALECLQAYKWPGNVRELQNIVERVIIITDQNNVEIKHLPDTVTFTKSASSIISVSDILPLKEASDLVEKQLLILAKEKYGTTMKIAEALGVNQSTISRKLNKLDI